MAIVTHNCTLNKDLLRSTTCGYSLPQITDIYLANYEDVKEAVPGNATDGGVEVTAITMNASAKWYHIEPAKGSATYTDALVVSDNGAKYRTATLGFTVNGAYDAAMVDVLDALSLGRFVAVVKTAEGNYLMLGRVNPLEAASDGANLLGEGENGSNGIVISLTGNQTESAMPLSDAAVKTVKGEA